MLAGASLALLAALGAPGAAVACSGGFRKHLNGLTPVTILSTGGSITVLGSGIINGGPTCFSDLLLLGFDADE